MTVNIAILGTSSIAASYVSQLRRIDGVSVDWVYSRSLGHAREFSSRWGVPRGTDELDRILEDAAVTAVVILSDPSRHVDLASKALAAGKHMLVEKPLDTDLNKANTFYLKAVGYDRVISVVSQKRFDPVLRAMRVRLQEEAAGVAKTVQLSIMWHRDREYFEKGTGWRKKDSAVFLNQGIHWLDVLNWFFGTPARVEVVSRTSRSFLSCPDQTVALIRYEDGTLVSLCGGTFCDQSYPDQFTIYHTRGRLDYGKLASRDNVSRFAAGFVRRLLVRNRAGADPSFLQVTDFIDSIRENRSPVSTVEAALNALKLALALSHPDDGRANFLPARTEVAGGDQELQRIS